MDLVRIVVLEVLFRVDFMRYFLNLFCILDFELEGGGIFGVGLLGLDRFGCLNLRLWFGGFLRLGFEDFVGVGGC